MISGVAAAVMRSFQRASERRTMVIVRPEGDLIIEPTGTIGKFQFPHSESLVV